MSIRNCVEQLSRGVISADDVPRDVSERTRAWLEEASRAFTSELAAAPGAARSGRALAAAARGRAAVSRSSDVGWLCAVARGAGILERRGAFERLLELALLPGGLPPSSRAAALALCADRHASELALDWLRLSAALGGPGARSARERLEVASREAEAFLRRARAFSEGTSAEEPLAGTPPGERTPLFLFLRAHPPELVAHVATELERLAATDSADLPELLGVLRPAADPRLFPTLARLVLDDPRPEVRAGAASALGRTFDLRVPEVLRSAFSRASDVVERLVLAEALGFWGDPAGAELAAEALDEPDAPDESLQKLALYAIAAIGDPDLAERAFAALERSGSREVRVAAARAIGRAADGRGLRWLDAAEAGSAPEVLRATCAMARTAIAARLEARGESPPARYERRADPIEKALARPAGATVTRAHRFLVRWTLVRARIARVFGRPASAAAAYARAVAIDPTSSRPLLVEARWRLGRGELTEAVRCYRRVVAIDAPALAGRPRELAQAVQAMLARASELEALGHDAMARDLHEVLFGLDLTAVPPSLRVEVRRLRDRALFSSGTRPAARIAQGAAPSPASPVSRPDEILVPPPPEPREATP